MWELLFVISELQAGELPPPQEEDHIFASSQALLKKPKQSWWGRSGVTKAMCCLSPQRQTWTTHQCLAHWCCLKLFHRHGGTLQRGKITHCFSFLLKVGRSPWSCLYLSVWHISPAEPRDVLPVKSFCCGIFSTSIFPTHISINHNGHGDHGLVFSYKWLAVNLLLTWKLLLAKSRTHFPLVFLPWVSECCGFGWSFTHSILAGVQANVRNESTSWAASALSRLGLDICSVSGGDVFLNRAELCFQRQSGPL